MIDPIRVPRDGPLFEGHFPGMPILPGVALIDMLSGAVGCRPLGAIAHARLRRPVAPGDHLEVTARIEENGRVRAGERRGGEEIASGVLAAASALDDDPATLTAEASRRAAGLPPLDALLPHRGPMRFVTRVAGEAGDGITCEAEIPPDCGMIAGGYAPALAALEAAAQASAVWEALRRTRGAGPAGPRVAYLVGLEDVRFHVHRIAPSERFLASARLIAAAPPLAHYAIEASMDAMPIVRGTIATFLAG